ncbi:MAG: amino acid adenylation domain-containing protein, partial [Tumebacillaceae bacterium]
MHKKVNEWDQKANNMQVNTVWEPLPCIHTLFSEQARLTPERIAVEADGVAYRYEEVEWRANQLAHHLLKLGVQPHQMIGLCLNRSVEAVIAILAILKAGGAYVPLDPSYPQERLAWMVEDAQLRFLITQEERVANLPPVPMTVCIERNDVWETEAVLPPQAVQNADDPAYLMYTSGSTGTPKGVLIPHRGVVRLVQNTDYVQISAEDVFLQFAPLSFDASIFELFGALLNGARVVVYPNEVGTIDDLLELVEATGVTILWLTAGVFHQVASGAVERLRSVRQLLAGGDVLSAAHVKKLLRQLPEMVVINGYGPTENTTFTCCYRVEHPEQIGQSVPIGRPIANTEIYVLDEQMQPVPFGEAGELYAGGAGLALGYWRREALTEERFVHVNVNGLDLRLYKTGDQVRFLQDGNLEFLGRQDHQVKIRGF